MKQNALSVAIDTHTGNVSLKYTFPIKQHHSTHFEQVAQAYNIRVETFRGRKSMRTQCVFCITAPSNVAFTTFRIIQRQLMLLSRQCKVDELTAEINSLKA